MREKGSAIAGSGSNRVFRGASKYASQYGGKPSDYSKMKSSTYTTSSGQVNRTHWVQNQKTGKRYDFKTKMDYKR
jgi:filamentous hemagglutinin